MADLCCYTLGEQLVGHKVSLNDALIDLGWLGGLGGWRTWASEDVRFRTLLITLLLQILCGIYSYTEVKL